MSDHVAINLGGPAELVRYYVDSEAALGVYYDSQCIEPSGRFVGMTHRNLDSEFEDLRVELDRQVSLGLIATFEAIVRLDFENRTSRRHPEDTAAPETVSQVCRK